MARGTTTRQASRNQRAPQQQPTAKPAENAGEVARFEPTRLAYHPAIASRFGIDASAWKVLVESTWPSAKTPDSVVLALSYCKARNLDPFKRPVHIVPITIKKGNDFVEVETVWPAISETRTTAFRTKDYAGMDQPEFGPTRTFQLIDQIKEGSGYVDLPMEIDAPEWCQITVHRMVDGVARPFPGPRCYFMEFYAPKNRFCTAPNEQWRRKPSYMLEKCFGAETEVLTDQGFQRFDDVRGRILQVTDSGLEATDAVPFRQDWTGPMVYAGGDALNFRVTPNHDMITTGGKIEAGAMYDAATSVDKIRMVSCLEGTKPESSISDRALQIAAAFVCDGYRRPYGAFSIAVSRPYKIELLDRLGAWKSRRVRETSGDTAETETRTITTQSDKIVFAYDEDQVEGIVDLDKSFDVDRLLSLSTRQARLLVDTMLACDGADNGRGTQRFYSSRPSILAAFEIAAVAAGYCVSRRRSRISDIGGPNYSITVSDKASLPVLRYSPSQIGKDGSKAGLTMLPSNPDQVVWCCTVPSGVIVVRRDGLSMLCGNCAEATSLRRAFPEEYGDRYAIEELGSLGHLKTVGGAATFGAGPGGGGDNDRDDRRRPTPASEPQRSDFAGGAGRAAAAGAQEEPPPPETDNRGEGGAQGKAPAQDGEHNETTEQRGAADGERGGLGPQHRAPDSVLGQDAIIKWIENAIDKAGDETTLDAIELDNADKIAKIGDLKRSALNQRIEQKRASLGGDR